MTDLIRNIATVLFLSSIAGIVQMLRKGPTPHLCLLLGGSLASLGFILKLGVLALGPHSENEYGLRPTTARFMGSVPCVFGSLMVSYEGVWRLITTLRDFTLFQFFVSVLFVIGGVYVVSAIFRLVHLATEGFAAVG